MLKQKFFKSSVMRASLFLTSKDRKKLVMVTFAQIFMGFFDLVGVVAIGALAALSVQGVETTKAGNKVSTVLRLFHIESFSFQTQVAILGFFAAFILITKSVVSAYITRKTFYFLSLRNAEISSNLVQKVLSQNLVKLQKRTTQQIVYSVSSGIKDLIIGILATSIAMVADIASLIIILIGLFYIDPIIALAIFFLFGAVGYLLYLLLQVKALELGVAVNSLSVENNTKILETLNSYREIVVRNRRSYFVDEIGKIKGKLAKVSAELEFQPYVSKYVIETSAVVGGLVLSAYEFETNNAVHAIAILSVFMAASSRVAPSALRIQQGLLKIKSSEGSAKETFEIVSDLENVRNINDDYNPELRLDHVGFIPKIEISSLCFRYPESTGFALKDIKLSVEAGTSVAIVGPSGAGKTTLIDLILGVLEPESGSINISGVSPTEASVSWSGGISYVPQNIVISSGTIRENVAFGYSEEFASDELIWQALDFAQLKSTVSKLQGRLDAQIGEGGSKVSGGQRQRLGIARAIFTQPKLLVLDEATSSLDGKTESAISEAISRLTGKTTVVVVAHRLSTIRNVDQVVYLEKGQILCMGTLSYVRSKVPDFDEQAKSMGLN